MPSLPHSNDLTHPSQTEFLCQSAFFTLLYPHYAIEFIFKTKHYNSHEVPTEDLRSKSNLPLVKLDVSLVTLDGPLGWVRLRRLVGTRLTGPRSSSPLRNLR